MNLEILNIAGSALVSERLRMDIIASNLANVHTTHDAQGEANPYKRRIVQFQTVLDQKSNEAQGVTIHSVTEDPNPPIPVYEPGHPDADQHGYVFYPNISAEREMVDMVSAKASYEANVKTIQVFKSMFNAALEI